MPELSFQILRVEPVQRGLVPLLLFALQVRNQTVGEQIEGILLQAQIQIQSPLRSYDAQEKEKLRDLFGPPADWGRTLRNRLWTHATTLVRPFAGSTEAQLPVPCTQDLNLAGTKYFHALSEGEVPLLFLFSGTIFYRDPAERIQAQQISWNQESDFRLPVKIWQSLMEEHYPNCAWVQLHRDCFEQLYAYKRRKGLTSWEQTMEQLLAHTHREEVAA